MLPESAAELHSADDWNGYLALATDILWAATSRRWRSSSSTETATLRPPGPRPGEAGWPYRCGCGAHRCTLVAPVPEWVSPHWPSVGHEPVAVRLPRDDVTAVTAVTVGGQAFNEWRLDGSWLTRTDGQPWPDCGATTLVTYAYGKLPPTAGVTACVELAVELGRSSAAEPDQECRLPQRVTQVTRQGITFEQLNDLEFLDKGLTGIPGIDQWIKSVNPYSRFQRARIWSPDLPIARRTS